MICSIVSSGDSDGLGLADVYRKNYDANKTIERTEFRALVPRFTPLRLSSVRWRGVLNYKYISHPLQGRFSGDKKILMRIPR